MTAHYRNTEIHYEVSGEGTPIILLHGFLETSTIWKPFISTLENNSKQVITIDLLGHGKTGCTGYIHTMEEMAEAVHAVFLKQKISSATILGHSMGGYVALAFLEKHSELVAKIILLNSTPEADSDERKKNRDRAIALVKKNPQTFISMALANLFSAENIEKYHSEFENLKKGAFKIPLQGIIAAEEGMKIRTNRIEVLKNFNRQKIIIVGEKDPILNFSTIKSLASLCNCGFMPLSEGHMSYIENYSEIKKLCSSSII